MALTFTLTICGAVSATSYTELYVSPTGNDSYDGNDPLHPAQTIEHALGYVKDNGSTVHLANGVYSGTGDTNLTLNKNMTIKGESQADTVINGTGTNWIFNITNGAYISLINLTLTNGTASHGGAINSFDGCNVAINNCTFTYNTAEYGGAIFSYQNSNLTVIDSTFTNNSAANANLGGGAIFNHGNMVIIDSNFTDNKAEDGGAINNNNGGNLTVTGSNFTKNTANLGGAIGNVDGSLTVTKSTFTDNNATDRGGAIYNQANLVLTGNTFTSNAANQYGGAIFSSSALTIDGSSFVNNIADYGCAIRTYGSGTISGSTFIGNHGAGGTIYNNGVLDVISNTIKDNYVIGHGGAIVNYGTLNAHFNRIVGNIANQGATAILSDNENADATLNWWGSNSPDFSSLVTVNVNYDPWLVMNYAASPISIQQGTTSTLVADFRYDSNGVFHDPVSGHIPDGTPVTFTTNLGNVGSKSVVKYTVNGVATATLRGDEAAGEALTSAILDGQTLAKNVTITPSVSAASSISSISSNTVGMQDTGAPLAPIALAVLAVLSGFAGTRRK